MHFFSILSLLRSRPSVVINVFQNNFHVGHYLLICDIPHFTPKAFVVAVSLFYSVCHFTHTHSHLVLFFSFPIWNSLVDRCFTHAERVAFVNHFGRLFVSLFQDLKKKKNENMDVDIAWEECVGDLPLDTKNLPPLNALSSTCSSQLPAIDLLELLTYDHNNPDSGSARSPMAHEKLSHMCTTPPQETLSNVSPITQSPPSSSFSDFLTPMNEVCKTPSESSSAEHGNTTLPTSLSPTQSPPPSPFQTAQAGSNKKPKVKNNRSSRKVLGDESLQPAPLLTDQSQLVLELSTRLASAGAEATALRKRVAALSSENRSLRAALDHANARLIAVAQAASAPPAPTTTTGATTTTTTVATNPNCHTGQQPVMLGLAHLTTTTTDMTNHIANALTISDNSIDDNPRDRKKRKRMTGAATTMACVMFMWGALIASPTWLTGNSSASRTQPNLPAVWKGDATLPNVPVPSVPRVDRVRQSWQPNCMRVLKQLPDGSESAKVLKPEPMLVAHVNDDDDDDESQHNHDGLTTVNKMMVDVTEDKAAANVVANSDLTDPRHPLYSYVLCRDAQLAMDNLKACTSKMQNGQACGEPHTISLILPAKAAGLDDDENKTRQGQPALAEVQCSIISVAKIPVDANSVDGSSSSSPVSSSPSDPTLSTSSASIHSASRGRIIATVPETHTVIADH